MSATRRLRLGFVGPMLGRHPGRVVSQGEILADLLRRDGYTVRETSSARGRLLRLADTLRSIAAWRNEVDLLCLMVFSGPAFGVTDLASRLGRALRKPMIYCLRGGGLPEFAERRPGWVRRVLGRASALVAPSGYLAEFCRRWGFPTHVIPNVLAIERYPYRRRDAPSSRLLWMRTFHPLYHPELAVDAFERIARARPEARLTMAGEERGRLESTRARAAEKGLSGRVRFPGFLDASTKPAVFDEHDLFLNTNRVDNMPVSVLEAAAFGLPVVATAVGGIPYLLRHEETALLVPPGDAAAMAEAALRLLEEPALAARLSENGRALAEGCAWPAVRRQWETLFERVIRYG